MSTLEAASINYTFKQAFEKSSQANNVEIQNLRKEALNGFLATGLPTTKNEEWKYTNVSGLPLHTFKVDDFVQGPQAWASHTPFTQSFATTNPSNNLVMRNGHFVPQHSSILSPLHELEVLPLQEAISKNSRGVSAHYGRIASAANNPFIDLSTAFTADGIYIHVPEGKKVALPVHLQHLADGNPLAPIALPRLLVVLGANATLTISEVHLSAGSESKIVNSVVEVVLGEGATLHYTKIQAGDANTTLIDSTFIHQEAQSNLAITTITTTGQLVRNQLVISLAGSGAHANLFGLYAAKAGSHIDNHTEVRHLVPNCTSNESYRGMVRGRSVSVFNGKIYVAPDAQKTNAFQSNRNIVLHNEATVNTKPQLEIFADDVKCTHGATIGQLDEDALFYLRARGIGLNEATQMLLEAFALDILNHIEESDAKAFAQGLASDWFA
jgi:Fe-S cluster assembly protein SufD